MDRDKRKITLSVSPALLLLVALLIGAGVYFTGKGRREKNTLTIDDTALIVTKIRTLGELTTACYYDEMVLRESKKNSLWKDMDDQLVIIAKGTVRAGIDLLEMDPEDIRFSGDTVFVRLPSPQYLDVIVNPSDFEVFAETGKWTHQEVTDLQDSARRRLLMEADHCGLKRKAYEGAMDAVTDLLVASGYTYIRFDHIPSYVKLPHFGE